MSIYKSNKAAISNGKPVVYIAGKVSGLDYYKEVYPKFQAAQIELEAKGYTVINPVQHVERSASWPYAMRICLSLLALADHIFLLDNWEDSTGAILEASLCEALEISEVSL